MFFFVSLENAELIEEWITDVVVKDGKEYLNIKEIKLDMKVVKLISHLRSTNNNKEINDVINKVMNDNWKEIFHEMKPDLEKTISDVILALIKPIFDEIPYEELFLPKN